MRGTVCTQHAANESLHLVSGPDAKYVQNFGEVKAYVFSPEVRAMTHTKQGGIDSDGYLLFLSAFDSLDKEVTVQQIVDDMFIPRYEALLQISAIIAKVSV